MALDEWKQRTDDVTIEVDNRKYSIHGGKLTVGDTEYERDFFPEIYALVYAFYDLEKAYQEDTGAGDNRWRTEETRNGA